MPGIWRMRTSPTRADKVLGAENARKMPCSFVLTRYCDLTKRSRLVTFLAALSPLAPGTS